MRLPEIDSSRCPSAERVGFSPRDRRSRAGANAPAATMAERGPPPRRRSVVGENLDLARFHNREDIDDPQLVITP